MGQQISSDDSARTQVVEDMRDQQSRSASIESVLNTQHMSLASSANPGPLQSQMHTADNTAREQPPQKSYNFREDISRFTAPLRASLILQNKGNVARDHLASERTYLAYVRTSLACASAGVGEPVCLF